MEYLENVKESGIMATVSPKEMQGWAELAIKLERLSLGLSPDKPKSEIEKDKDKERKSNAGNVTNITNIKTQQNQQNQLLVNNPTNGLTDKEHRKFLQEVANTLMTVNPGVIENGTTINSEPDVEARIDNSESETDTQAN
jgi:hypothetical protein